MAMTKRRTLVAANAAVTVIALAVLFILVNYIGSRRYVRTDVTKTRITRLSPKTVQVLRDLNDPVQVAVFYQQSHRLFEFVQDLLDRYAAHTDKLKIEYIDPEQDLARTRQLVQQYQIDLNKDPLNQVIFSAGGRTKFLSDSDVAEFDYSRAQMGGAPTLAAFKGEDAFTSAIINVTQAAQPTVWFVSGHGEKDLEDRGGPGASELGKYLQRENMQVSSQTLLDKAEIPATVNAVVIAGPARRFSDQEVALLQAYLEKGGRVLAMIDPATSTGLDDLLARWGAQLGQDIVIEGDPQRRLPFVSPGNLLVVTYTDHPIVRHMEMLITLFPLARSVKAVPGDQGATAKELAVTSESGWGETSIETQPFQRDEQGDNLGPVPIAVAVERTSPAQTRLVVIGDSDFAGNDQLVNVGNLDLILGAFHWLVGQEQLIGIGPKPIASLKLNVTARQLSNVWWACFLGMPVLFGLLGVVMWRWRRT
jgi:ABC-type uncharacterized transport system involved in gliding motility auxiliary subunit